MSKEDSCCDFCKYFCFENGDGHCDKYDKQVHFYAWAHNENCFEENKNYQL